MRVRRVADGRALLVLTLAEALWQAEVDMNCQALDRDRERGTWMSRWVLQIRTSRKALFFSARGRMYVGRGSHPNFSFILKPYTYTDPGRFSKENIHERLRKSRIPRALPGITAEPGIGPLAM